jgi:hypothetical protein
VAWIDVSEKSAQVRVVLNVVMNICVLQMQTFLQVARLLAS